MKGLVSDPQGQIIDLLTQNNFRFFKIIVIKMLLNNNFLKKMIQMILRFQFFFKLCTILNFLKSKLKSFPVNKILIKYEF